VVPILAISHESFASSHLHVTKKNALKIVNLP
jgi:hypothetical protein